LDRRKVIYLAKVTSNFSALSLLQLWSRSTLCCLQRSLGHISAKNERDRYIQKIKWPFFYHLSLSISLSLSLSLSLPLSLSLSPSLFLLWTPTLKYVGCCRFVCFKSAFGKKNIYGIHILTRARGSDPTNTQSRL
jgi:hypothetical protein